jgi:hypothetical protein
MIDASKKPDAPGLVFETWDYEQSQHSLDSSVAGAPQEWHLGILRYSNF